MLPSGKGRDLACGVELSVSWNLIHDDSINLDEVQLPLLQNLEDELEYRN